jgi:exopolysaccharide production protein ExoZ
LGTFSANSQAVDLGDLPTVKVHRDSRSGVEPQQGPSPARRTRLDALQGLRGCAALLVVVTHSVSIFRGASGDKSGSAIADACGVLGVSAFFVVSGFLMVYVHGRDFGQSGATRKFYARRIARIVPLYWAVTILYAAKQIYFGQATGWETVRSLLFVPYQTADGLWRPVLGQGWTLNYEMAFYLVFGLALMVPRGVWIVFAVFGTLSVLHLTGVFGPANVFAFWSHPIVLYFLAGVAIGLLRTKAQRGPSFAVAFTVAFAVLVVSISLAPLFGSAQLGYLAWVVPIAAVVSVAAPAFAREDHRTSMIRRLAGRIGDASYSIYLTHTLVIAPAVKVFVARFFPDLHVLLFVLLMLPTTALVGYAVFRYVERPLIRIWTRVFINRAEIRTTTPAAA